MPFEGMLVHAGILKHQRKKIFEQLGTKEIQLTYKGKHAFEIEDVRFEEAMTSKNAAKQIRASSNIGVKRSPFDIEHLLADFIRDRNKFKHDIVFAAKRTYEVEGKPHIFMMTMDKSNPDLELVPDDHAWAARTSVFPKCHKIV